MKQRFRRPLSDAVDYYTANPPKGECVIVMEGRSRVELQKEAQMRWEELSVSEHVAHYIESGDGSKRSDEAGSKRPWGVKAGDLCGAAGSGAGVKKQ